MLKNILIVFGAFALLSTQISCSNSNNEKKSAAQAYQKSQISGTADNVSENTEKEEFVKIITDKNFKKTIKSGVTMVDFWATWCKPCLMQAPIVEQIAAEMKDQVLVGKMDVDLNPSVPRKFNIANIPTIMIFKDGEMVERFVGLKTKAELTAALEKHLN